MNRKLLTKIDLYVFVWGAIIVLGSLFFRERLIIFGALAGAIIAALNWLGFRWAGVRMAATGNKSRFGVFLAVKSFLVLAVVYAVVVSGAVSPLAFMIGLSSLVLGILTRSTHQALVQGSEALKEER